MLGVYLDAWDIFILGGVWGACMFLEIGVGRMPWGLLWGPLGACSGASSGGMLRGQFWGHA